MTRYVSDALVDLLRDLGCRYLPLNPGSSFRGLHDSLANREGTDAPEIILCTHEEIAVAAAHAYAKAMGRPAFAAVHDLVGLMHATMAVYDAWCDRAPVVLLGGGGPADPAERRPIDWFHSANTQSTLVRPFVKWDDDPATAQAMLDGVVQAHRMAMSGPAGPTYVTLDSAIQESPAAEDLLNRAAEGLRGDPPLAARAEDIDEVVELLMAARLPVVMAGRVGLDAACTPLLVRLAEALGAACRDERNHTALPTAHALNLNGDEALLDEADVVLAVDLHDVSWVLGDGRSAAAPAVVDISLNSLAVRSWANAGAAMRPMAHRLVSEPRVALAQIIAAVEKRLETETEHDGRARAERVQALTDRHHRLRTQQRQSVEEHWDDSPISVSRMVSEVHEAVRHLPWLLTLRNTRSWPEGVWEFDRGGRYLGHSGGGGMGYGPGALLGGGLAARDRGEFPVGIIGDGDLMFAPGALWSAVHYRVPMLVVVNNNHSYYNDEHHQAIVAKQRGRSLDNVPIGTRMVDPGIDFCALARSQGAWAIEPVRHPGALDDALSAAVAQVLDGRVALVDVHTGVS